MKKVIVRYKVKPDSAEENKRLIKNVFAELNKIKPAGIKYASYVMADKVSFVHIASIDTEDGSNPLSQIQAFKDFTKDIKERCEEPPFSSDVEEIGNFGY
jgi:L-rhamnose mutarotase